MKIKLSYDSESWVLPGFGHTAVWLSGIKSEDQSGDTSSTADSHKGFKAGMITASTNIKFGDLDSFSELSELFHAVDDNKPRVYDILYKEINAWGIDKVRFVDDIRIAPDGKLKVYNITMTLKQERSVPEKTEERTAMTETAETTQADGLESAGESSGNIIDLEADSDSEASGTVETILKKANDAAGDLFFQ